MKRFPEERAIYVMDCDTDDLVKIGSTVDLARRIAHLRYERKTVRTMYLRWAMRGESEAIKRLESAVHKRLKGRAKAGREWYRFDTNGAVEVVRKTAREMGIELRPDYQTGSTF